MRMTMFVSSGSGRRGLLACVVIAFFSCLLTVADALAASRSEVTWVTSGAIRLRPGQWNVTFNLPRDPAGPIESPFVLLGSYRPQTEVPTSQAATAPAAGPTAKLKLRIGNVELPEWTIPKYGSAFAINTATLHAVGGFAQGRIELKFDAQMTDGEITLYGLAAPDPLLLGRDLNGPFSTFAEKANDPDVKAYFNALAKQFAGGVEQARIEFRKLRDSKNERVGTFARRGLRIIKGLTRPSGKLPNFAERYRWALYFQQCGFFQMALDEFFVCTQLDPAHGTSWFRLGEMSDRAGIPAERMVDFFERAGRVMAVGNPTVWNMLVVFLREREIEVVENGQKAKKIIRLSDDDIKRLREQWVIVEKMVFGASRGTLVLNTAYFEVKNEAQQAYAEHCGFIVGPADDLIEERGWFDGVISIRPHMSDEIEQTCGGDCGPNGAALSDLDMSADWGRMLRQFNNQLNWAMNVCEAGTSYPITDDGVGCGHSPIPSEGYGIRAALRYYETPAMFRHAKVVPTRRPKPAPATQPTTTAASSQPTTQPTASTPEVDSPMDTYLRYWQFHGPFAVTGTPPTEGEPPSHVLDDYPLDEKSRGPIVDSQTDWIDLGSMVSGRGWSVVRAVCWVKSHELQHVQMWLGYQDRLAVWVNGRCVHRGVYVPQGKYAGKPQPDLVASFATFEPGWNRIEVAVEAWPSPRGHGCGFSMALRWFDGSPVDGLRFSVVPPTEGLVAPYAPAETGYYYRWDRCEGAYHDTLPRLSEKDLESVTGVRGLKFRGNVGRIDGMVAFEVAGRKPDASYREVPAKWDPKTDRDVLLNNVLDWAREDVCAIRYEKEGHQRDLLLLKPEAFEAYLTLLKEPPEAAKLFGQNAPIDRVVGYIVVPSERGSGRTLIVADVLFSAENEPWPRDEEDLLDPEQK